MVGAMLLVAVLLLVLISYLTRYLSKERITTTIAWTEVKKMKRYTNEKKEDTITILTAFFVMFSAIIEPLVSAVIAIDIPSCIGIWKISNKWYGVNKNENKDQRITGDNGNDSVCWRDNVLSERNVDSRTDLRNRCSGTHFRVMS